MNIDRREFLGMTAAGIAGALAPLGASAETEAAAAQVAGQRAVVPSYTIRDYLSLEAQRITNGALRGMKDSEAFNKLIPERRKQYMEMMGLGGLDPADKRSPVPVHVTGIVDRPAYKIEKLHYESLPNLHVTGNLYVPK